MHKELKNEFADIPRSFFHPLCLATLQKFPPESKFPLLKCFFQHLLVTFSLDKKFATYDGAVEAGLSAAQGWIDRGKASSSIITPNAFARSGTLHCKPILLTLSRWWV